MEIRQDEITRIIKEQIASGGRAIVPEETGQILSVGDGIANVWGLSGAMAGELVVFPNSIVGIVLNLEEDHVGCAIMGEYEGLHEGDPVKRTSRIAQVPVGDALKGRVVDALGNPIDGLGPIEASEFRNGEAKAPGIVDRRPVAQPLYTGIKAIDAMTPIGRGQRELIIGDRQTGKTAIAVDAIINQLDKDVHCIYVAIGQKVSTVAAVVDKFKREGAMKHTTVVAANASDPAPLQYLAPYSGVAMGEYYRDRGGHVLIVYDDLSKHAVAYRQMSLLLRRPPGREAYPGDVFYLHSRLLERAAKLSEENGGGSLTAIPIIETQAGDISAYVPTNVISITDGQIYLEKDLFYAGIRPAMNVGLSISRVGGAAQVPVMKKVAGCLRITLAQFRELESFSQFGAELDPSTRKQLTRGERLVEMLKQEQFVPMPVEHQAVQIFAGVSGYLDDIPLGKVRVFLKELVRKISSDHPDVWEKMREKEDLTNEIEKRLREIIESFKKGFA